MYKNLKKKFRRWKKRMKKNGEETIARYTSFNLFCFKKRKKRTESPSYETYVVKDEDGKSDSPITASKYKCLSGFNIKNYFLNPDTIHHQVSLIFMHHTLLKLSLQAFS